jgi:hypothetical protein
VIAQWCAQKAGNTIVVITKWLCSNNKIECANVWFIEFLNNTWKVNTMVNLPPSTVWTILLRCFSSHITQQQSIPDSGCIKRTFHARMPTLQKAFAHMLCKKHLFIRLSFKSFHFITVVLEEKPILSLCNIDRSWRSLASRLVFG